MQCMTYAPRQSGHFLTCVPLSYAIDLIDPNEYESHTRHPRWIERKATWILIRLRAAFFSLSICFVWLSCVLFLPLACEMRCNAALRQIVCAHTMCSSIESTLQFSTIRFYDRWSSTQRMGYTLLEAVYGGQFKYRSQLFSAFGCRIVFVRPDNIDNQELRTLKCYLCLLCHSVQYPKPLVQPLSQPQRHLNISFSFVAFEEYVSDS